MAKKKDLRARVDPDDYSTGQKILDRLGLSMQDALQGWWFRLIHGDEDAEAAASDYHRAKADVEALERREERLEERIEQLEEEREEIREERREAEERLSEAEDNLVDSAASAHADGGDGDGENSIESVAYEMLVQLAHGEIGSNGITGGYPAIREAALRVGCEPDELIEEMREQVDGVTNQSDKLVERGLMRTDDDMQNRMGIDEFESHRRFIANGVLDEEDVDWDRIPDSPY